MSNSTHDDSKETTTRTGLRLTLATAWVAAALWWWLAEPPWVGLGAASLATLLLGWRFPDLLTPPRTPEHVVVDERGVFRDIAGGLHEEILWDDLVRVTVITTDEGPFAEDLFFLLHDRQGGGCLVSNEKAVETDLVAALQRLPGFDNLALIHASTSIEWAEALLWEAPATRPVPS